MLQTIAVWVLVAGSAVLIVFGVDEAFWVEGEMQPRQEETVATGRLTPEGPADDEGEEAPEAPAATVVIDAGPSGHFFTTADVNGTSVKVMVDTGATTVALTWEDAEKAGIRVRPSDFTGRVRTANGTAGVAPVTIDHITIGAITLYDVEATVSEKGRLATTLLGMTFLSRLARFEISRGRLALEQ
jgi:aspartyl protease family protein